MGITDFIAVLGERLIGSIGYGGLFFLMIAESMVLTVPSEALLPFAGFLMAKGTFTLWGVPSTLLPVHDSGCRSLERLPRGLRLQSARALEDRAALWAHHRHRGLGRFARPDGPVRPASPQEALGTLEYVTCPSAYQPSTSIQPAFLLAVIVELEYKGNGVKT